MLSEKEIQFEEKKSMDGHWLEGHWLMLNAVFQLHGHEEAVVHNTEVATGRYMITRHINQQIQVILEEVKRHYDKRKAEAQSRIIT